MPSNLTDVDSFDTAIGPLGTDIRNAQSVRDCMQTVANRTRFLYNRTAIALADVTTLKAVSVSGIANLSIRTVSSQGDYVYDSARSDAESLPWVVAPNTGTGRWILANAAALLRSFAFRPDYWSHNTVASPASYFFAAGTTDLTIFDGHEYATPANYVPVALHAVKFSEVYTASSTGYVYAQTLGPEHLPQGRTLSTIALWIDASGTSHASLPQNKPALTVVRTTRTGATYSKLQSGGTNGWSVDSSASVAAYETPHDLVFTANQNNVVDHSTYIYALGYIHEGGSSAKVNVKCGGILITCT